uniref:ATP-dependent (S)-NAD(P)H-hydrate dehydratase n=2 Tax=Cacopsylla melanoneura TaxID=428564 RepID=A0A8D8WE03_9HEMI
MPNYSNLPSMRSVLIILFSQIFVSCSSSQLKDFLDNNMTMSSNSELFQDLIPTPHQFDKHKGQMGRICVIGGSLQYTGAAYYAAMSSLLAGADLVYMVCCEGAVPILKTYSPELIVLPHYLDQTDSVQHIMPWMSRMHAVLIGPGLGTDSLVQSNVISIIENLKSSNLTIPLLLDADGLKILAETPTLLKDYQGPVYLTPNKREYSLLFPGEKRDIQKTDTAQIGPKVTMIVKGPEDIIVNNQNMLTCKEENSWRRCGGQGDLVAGTLATMSHYATLKSGSGPVNTPWELRAGLAACSVVRRSNRLAYQLKGRSMLATDMIHQLHTAFKQMIPNW